MWKTTQTEIPSGRRFAFKQGDTAMSFQDVFKALADSTEFRSFFIKQLQSIDYAAYRWETPAYTQATLNQAFEFVAIASPELDRPADPSPFNDYLSDAHTSIVGFENLGKDAYLLVPTEQYERCNYCHLASFTQTASDELQQALWQQVGEQGLALASDSPVWLNTSGGGVAWLHIRFDSQPKYYRFNEFKRLPKAL